MYGLPEGFVVDEPRATDDLPEGFAVDAPVNPLPPAAPKPSGGVIKTVLDPIIGAGKEAWRTTKEQAQSGWGNIKHGLGPDYPQPDENFFEYTLRGAKELPGKFVDTGKGALELAGLPLAPAIGAGKYAIGKPMAHLLSVPNKITGKGPTADEVYEDIRDDVGTAIGTIAPGARPRAPRLPNRVMGVRLSEGQRTGELPLIQREQAARRNQSGEQAQRETQAWFDNQAQEVASALENTMIDMDPMMTGARGGQRHLVAETPLEAGQIVSNGILQTRNMRRETVSNFYETARQQPGVIQADFFDNIGHRIKQDLSGGTEPVVINERLTPFADMAMQDIDQNVSNLIMQNRASPHPQPPRSQIYGIDLSGVDFMRRRLVSRRRDAYNSGNESDGRAMSALVDAFDSQINQAMNGGRFTGNPRAVGYWNDARAAHAQYKRDFSAGQNDPAGKAIERIVGRNNNAPLIANDVVDEIFGSTGTNPSHKNVEVARRIQRILGSDSPEWVAVRQGLFSRLVEPAPGVSEYSPRRVRDRINNFLQNGRELADEVFTADQQARLREFAGLNERLIVPQAGANWSNNRFNSVVNRGIQGGAAVAGGLVGHGLLPIPGVGEVLGVAGGNYAGKKIVDARNARQVRQQLPGADAQQQQARSRYTATSPAARSARGASPRIPNRPESASRRAASALTLTDQEDDPEHKRHSIESMVSLPRYAEGGEALAGQPIVVGEAGLEVIVPQEDVDVIPNYETMFTPGSPMINQPPAPQAPSKTRNYRGREVADWSQRDPEQAYEKSLENLAYMRDNPSAAIENLGMVGGIVGSAMEHQDPAQQRGLKPLGTPRKAGFGLGGSEADPGRPIESFEAPLPEPDPTLVARRGDIQKDMGSLDKSYQDEKIKHEAAYQQRAAKQYPTAKARENDANQHQNALNKLAQQYEGDKEKLLGRMEKIDTDIQNEQLKQQRARQGEMKVHADAEAKRLAGERPLMDKYPSLMALPYIGAAFAGAATYVTRTRAIEKYNEWVSRLDKQIKTTEKKVGDFSKGGKAKKPSFEEMAREQKTLAGYSDQASEYDKLINPGFWKAVSDKAGPAIGGGALALELALVPYQLDWALQAPDSAAGKEARKRLTTVEGWLKNATAALAGFTGASVGSTVPTRVKPKTPNIERAKALSEESLPKPGTVPIKPGQAGLPPAQFSKDAAKARQKTAEESLQGVEKKLAGQN